MNASVNLVKNSNSNREKNMPSIVSNKIITKAGSERKSEQDRLK